MEKKLLAGQRFTVAVASSIGNRDYMQDVFAVVLQHSQDNETDYMGVFDGHGINGEKVATYVGLRLDELVLSRLVKANFTEEKRIIKSTFLELDKQMRMNRNLTSNSGFVTGGSTAVCMWIRKNRMLVAHVGDSRAVMSVNGKAVPLTRDHKPMDMEEAERIRQAGGFIYVNRVKGVLALSRAFGDYRFKDRPDLAPQKQMVSADPDVTVIETQKNAYDFIALMSDGVSDVLSDQLLVNLILQMMEERWSLENIAESIVERCTRSPYQFMSRDNTTLIIAVPVDGGSMTASRQSTHLRDHGMSKN